MTYRLDFDRFLRDDLVRDGIFLPITLHHGDNNTSLEAQVDTGASCCIFQRELGVDLGLDVENGFRQEIHTVTGGFTTYGHTVTVSVLGFDSRRLFTLRPSKGSLATCSDALAGLIE